MFQFFQAEYLIDIEIGIFPQRFQVIPDTGSSDFWVNDITCFIDGDPERPCYYNSKFKPNFAMNSNFRLEAKQMTSLKRILFPWPYLFTAFYPPSWLWTLSLPLPPIANTGPFTESERKQIWILQIKFH